MKIFYLIFVISFYCTSIKSQTVIVSGQCMTGAIVLNPNGTMDGKPAYSGTGTVEGIPGIQVNVYWLASDNLWVLDFDGQPYFQNPCTANLPSSTGVPGCPWSPVEGQTCTGATLLAINGLGTLAVTFTSFTAKIDRQQVLINWKTAIEINNKGFDIQRSPDGSYWNSIGFVNSNLNPAAEKSYQFSDLKPLPGKSFYRLRQVDLNDKYLYSKVVSVNFLKSGFYSLSGNPGNNIYKVNIEATTEKIELSVLDAGGKTVMKKMTGLGVQILDLNKFPPGIYLLRIIKGTDMITEKLVKF
ncbi:MAG: T9SS type A sorting domain-containing protein [Ferruginibacter sp.]